MPHHATPGRFYEKPGGGGKAKGGGEKGRDKNIDSSSKKKEARSKGSRGRCDYCTFPSLYISLSTRHLPKPSSSSASSSSFPSSFSSSSALAKAQMVARPRLASPLASSPCHFFAPSSFPLVLRSRQSSDMSAASEREQGIRRYLCMCVCGSRMHS